MNKYNLFACRIQSDVTSHSTISISYQSVLLQCKVQTQFQFFRKALRSYRLTCIGCQRYDARMISSYVPRQAWPWPIELYTLGFLGPEIWRIWIKLRCHWEAFNVLEQKLVGWLLRFAFCIDDTCTQAISISSTIEMSMLLSSKYGVYELLPIQASNSRTGQKGLSLQEWWAWAYHNMLGAHAP